MKIRIFKDCASYMKTTPFEVVIDGEIYSGVLTESKNSVGGMEIDTEYVIEWDDKNPGINDSEVINLILKEYDIE